MTFRHSQAVWVPIVAWIVCALAVGDAIVEGSTGYAARATLIAGTVAYVVYIGLARPSLRVDDDGITIANVLHTNRIPFGALIDLRVGGMTSVIARTSPTGERRITSWNAPGVPRRIPRPGNAVPSAVRGEVEILIDKRWEAWKLANPRDSGQSLLVRNWNRTSLAIAIALIVLNIAIWLR